MLVVLKILGYGLLAWVVSQPVKGVIRFFRRRRALRYLSEHYAVERIRTPTHTNVHTSLPHRNLSSFPHRPRPGGFYQVHVQGFDVNICPGLRTLTLPWTWTTLKVHLGYGLPSGFSLSQRSTAPLVSQVLPQAQTMSCDLEFDRLHHFRGEQPELASYLSESRRRALAALARFEGSVQDGYLIIAHKHVIFNGPRLHKSILEAVSVAKVLAVPREQTGPIPGLVANASSDDLAQVRTQNLRFLYQYYGDSTAASTLTEQLLSDVEPELRLEAACHRPGGSEAVLLEFLRGDHSLELCSRALRALGECQGSDVVACILGHLTSTSPELRLAAIYAAGKAKLQEAREPLMNRFRATEGEEREHLATALASICVQGDSELEERLLDSLREPPICKPGPIIHALEKTGSIDAVEKLLKALAGAYGGTRHDRHAAKEAIMRIQGRAPGAQAGQLSVAELRDVDGALSLETSLSEDE
jgi:hypothetical protein